MAFIDCRSEITCDGRVRRFECRDTWSGILSLARASWGVRVPSVFRTCRKWADLKERQVPESEVDTAGAPVMGDIFLRAQDKKGDKWDVIFERPSRGLCECTVIAD